MIKINIKKIIKNGLSLAGICFLFLILPLLSILRYLFRLRKPYRLRSIWTGAPVINMTVNAKAEQRLGFQAFTIVRNTYYITNKFDLDISSKTKNQWVADLLTYMVFIWVCVTADRVHAYVDGGLLPSKRLYHYRPLELFFYNVLKIKLFIWTYGADVRTRQMTLNLGEPNCCTDCVLIGSACICDEQLFEKNYQKVSQVAKAVFSMGDMIEYTPDSVTDLFFWPIDFEQDFSQYYSPSYPTFSAHKPLRIVHAPNHRHFKGTKYLEHAVNQLIQEGINIELILVEKKSNAEALTVYRSADLIFDQCLIGFHGYFAIEAMALGKPVICFIRDPKRYLLDPEHCPIQNVHRDNLKDMLRHFASVGRASLPEIGRQSRMYVEKYYNLDAFANRLKKSYEVLGVMA